MDISCQEQVNFLSYMPTSSVQLCTRDVHRDLRNGQIDSLKDWIRNGKSARYFVKRAISYPYRVRYEITRTLCYDLIRNTTIPHPGFYTLGRKRLYDWTFLEILQRCHNTVIHISDPDEIWAFHSISLGNMSSTTRYYRWKSIIQVFDGSLRWVRLLAAFLCSVSNDRRKMFNRYHMVNGWIGWMDSLRKYELLRCIYPTFSKASPADVIRTDNGEISMMGLVWACTNDEPDCNIICEHGNNNINDGIFNIFSDDCMSLTTSDTDTIGEDEMSL